MTKYVLLAIALLLAGLGAGCGDESTPTTPSTTTPVTETFSSNLDPKGAVWRVFTVRQSGTMTATLSSTSQPLPNECFKPKYEKSVVTW